MNVDAMRAPVCRRLVRPRSAEEALRLRDAKHGSTEFAKRRSLPGQAIDFRPDRRRQRRVGCFSAECAELMFEVLLGLRRDISPSPFLLEFGDELSGYAHRLRIGETVGAASSFRRSHKVSGRRQPRRGQRQRIVLNDQPTLRRRVVQAILKSGIFQSPTSVSARSSRVSVDADPASLVIHGDFQQPPGNASAVCLTGRFRAIRGRPVIRCSVCSPMSASIMVAAPTDQ